MNKLSFPVWHYTEDNDYPENYRELVNYTLKCAEYTPKVLCITKSCKCRLYFRNREITEADFKWRGSKEVNDNDKPNVIAWAFLPSGEYRNVVINRAK